MSMRDLISREAELDDEENEDDSFDEETGEGRPGKTRESGDMDDSSEEEEDDDDEEAARAVCRPPECLLEPNTDNPLGPRGIYHR